MEEIEINGFWQSEERVEAELVLTKSIQQKKNKLKAQIKCDRVCENRAYGNF